ncbi:MAG: hypothetical protein HGA45_13035 [Chloroflexales bacterium]|nr:hypothetical protein [Chloroflexales bacterium]
MLTPAPLAVFSVILATLLGNWFYFRHCRIAQPPIGAINLWDVAFVLVVIVSGTYLNPILPNWLIAGLFTLCALSLLDSVAEPLIRTRWARWLLVGGLVATDIAAWIGWGAMSMPFLIINNLVLLASIVGIANLWAQGGMRARDLALLVSGLTLYDISATWLTTMTADLFQRLATLPFTPLIAWPVEAGVWVGVGVGDTVMAALSPLILGKAFGQRAGILTLALNLGLLAALLLLASRGVQFVFPVMVLLGPLIVMQYGYWRWRWGSEQTTAAYRGVAAGGPVMPR